MQPVAMTTAEARGIDKREFALHIKDELEQTKE